MSRTTAPHRPDESRTRHIDIALGQRVRRLRQDHGLTQIKVCEALGISSNQWSRHESGENRIPAARLWQFCHLIGADVRTLFDGLPHFVGPVEKAMGVSEVSTPFDHAAEGDGPEGNGADTRAIASAARRLPASSRQLLLTIARALSEGASKQG